MQARNRSREVHSLETGDVVRRFAPSARKIVPVAIAAKVVLLFLLALNARFVMDEFVQLGQAKYLGRGFFTTIWPVKAVGYTVFYEFAHLLGRDATSILLIGRVQTAMLGCAIAGMIYACSRSLAATRQQALLVVLVLLSFSNFIERIFRTRSEPLAVFFAVAALLVIVRRSSPTANRVFFAGILSGLAFVTTQKSIYFNFALGLGLMVDAAFSRHFLLAFRRGALLVLGWTIPIIAYCLVFGGADALLVARNLYFGPADLVSAVPATYSGLRVYVWQTLSRNALLYVLCFSALAIASARYRSASSPRRIALVFSITITALVFTHNQPWPYVFVMALPFLALWIPALLSTESTDGRQLTVGATLTVAIIISFAKNIDYFRIGDSEQFAVVRKAERLLGPDERYFDGVGMIPNRREPSTLWLDHPLVLRTLMEGHRSEAFQIFSRNPPKVVIWSYRLDAIEPVVGPLIRANYVHVAPNIWIAGRRLESGRSEDFSVATAGPYGLYDATGKALSISAEVDGKAFRAPFQLAAGRHRVALLNGPREALLLREADYAGQFVSNPDNAQLFAGVYD